MIQRPIIEPHLINNWFSPNQFLKKVFFSNLWYINWLSMGKTNQNKTKQIPLILFCIWKITQNGSQIEIHKSQNSQMSIKDYRNKHLLFWDGKYSSDLTIKAWQTKEKKIDKLDFYQNKNLFSSKNNVRISYRLVENDCK